MNAVNALGFSLLIWAIYYRISVGPWCQAMWFGTAPALVISISFIYIYRYLKKSED